MKEKLYEFIKDTATSALQDQATAQAAAHRDEEARKREQETWRADLEARVDALTADRLEDFLRENDLTAAFFDGQQETLPEEQLRAMCDAFFDENPTPQQQRAETEVALRHAADRIYRTLRTRMTEGERMLYQQGAALQKQIDALHRMLSDARRSLSQTQKQQVFRTIMQQLDAGLLEESLALIELLEDCAGGAAAAAVLRTRHAYWKESSLHYSRAFDRACELADADWLRISLCSTAAMAGDTAALRQAAQQLSDPTAREMLLKLAECTTIQAFAQQFSKDRQLQEPAASSPAVLWRFSQETGAECESVQARLAQLAPGLVTKLLALAAQLNTILAAQGDAVRNGRQKETILCTLYEMRGLYQKMGQLHEMHRSRALALCTKYMCYLPWPDFAALRDAFPADDQHSSHMLLGELRHRVYWGGEIPSDRIDRTFIPGCGPELAQLCTQALLRSGAAQEAVRRIEADPALLEQPTDLLALYVRALLLSGKSFDPDFFDRYTRYYPETPTIDILRMLVSLEQGESITEERRIAFAALSCAERPWGTKDIFLYVELCERLGLYDEALALLEHYAPLDVVFRHEQIRLLISTGKDPARCAGLIRELDRAGSALAEEYYRMGALQEDICAGGGKPWFEKAYQLDPKYYYADALCTARLNRQEPLDDAALRTLAETEQPRAQRLTACTCFALGQAERGERHLMHALLLCGTAYDEDIYQDYVNRRFLDSAAQSPAPPASVGGECAVTLTREDGTIVRLCLHSVADVLPETAPVEFAGYQHFALDDPAVSELIYAGLDDRVLFDGHETVIRELEPVNSVLTRYCLQALVAHSAVKQISFETPEEGLEQVRTIMQAGARDRQALLEQLKQGKTTVYAASRIVGKPFFITQLAQWEQQDLCAGPDGADQVPADAAYLLTCGSALLLSQFELALDTLTGLSMPAAGKRFLLSEMAAEERTLQREGGTLYLSETDEMGMLHHTDDVRRMAHRTRTRLHTFLHALDDAPETDEIDLIPDAREAVSELVGASDWQAIAAARAYGLVLVSDDWMLTLIARLAGVCCVNTAGLLRALPLALSRRTEILCSMLRHGYRTPLSKTLIADLDHALSALPAGEEKERLAAQIIELLSLGFEQPQHRNDLLLAIRRSPDEPALSEEMIHYLARLGLQTGLVSAEMLRHSACAADEDAP